eukprot:GHVU01046769.1.p1 GENE.GHVU01046769.1~~GHVU01046769.1.p1  ORF type:complete len:103 (-),score=5.84 GHVU01046769.1:35-343(-)
MLKNTGIICTCCRTCRFCFAAVKDASWNIINTNVLLESLLMLPTLPSVESLLACRFIILLLISAAAPTSSLLWNDAFAFFPARKKNLMMLNSIIQVNRNALP